MEKKYTLAVNIAYADVDREESMLLSAAFKFLQEAAIKHANLFDVGTRAMTLRGESWVLHRMAVSILRYPRYEESLRIETWSRGISGFRGYREFRVFCGDELVISASSLWLYVNTRTKTLVRVPIAIADNFPVVDEKPFAPDFDRSDLDAPILGAIPHFPVSIRYSDIDSNSHLNNATYLDFLQTALSKAALPPRPAQVQIKFIKEIAPDSESLHVALEPRAGHTRFSIASGATIFAVGQIS